MPNCIIAADKVATDRPNIFRLTDEQLIRLRNDKMPDWSDKFDQEDTTSAFDSDINFLLKQVWQPLRPFCTPDAWPEFLIRLAGFYVLSPLFTSQIEKQEMQLPPTGVLLRSPELSAKEGIYSISYTYNIYSGKNKHQPRWTHKKHAKRR